MFGAAFLLAACPQAPTSEPEDAAIEANSTPEAVDAAPNAGQLLAGTVTARFGANAEEVLTASECAITNAGANGIIRAGDGAFELSWANGTFRLIWTHAAGTYQGEVTGNVLDGGGGVSFTGSANGQSAQGFAVCNA